ACVAAVFAAGPAGDPVLMTVAGKDVPLSEFQYLYNKNNNQQLEPITPAKYLDMFVDYKLKVADAEAAGIDTTAAFRAEYAQYRDELAKPYMRDQWVTDSLVMEAYGHYADDVTVSHIMLPATQAGHDRADSLLREIRAGHTTFADAATAFSMDAPSAAKGGRMGNVVPGRYPWVFEKTAYDTPAGAVSEPVNSGFGWHLIKVDARRPSQGEVHAAHILRMTRGLSPEQAAREREIIDSLHTVAASGADFADLATRFSQDPGSARRGGDLGWFARGMMVQPFDSISFALPEGGLSEPFATDFGWHIIYKYGSRNARDLDQMRPQIEKAMERDDRGTAAERSYATRMIARHGGSVAAWQPAVQAVLATAEGPLDSVVASPALAAVDAFTIDGRTVALAAVAPRLAGVVTSPDVAATTLAAVDEAGLAALSDAALALARAER
ncbi:MAG: peptidylprolyl isomerase, partial [Muribaculaceae bacterium]|nr:peptidylprolyl isomerase [Muribaculaceae bacterium]